MAKKKRRFPWSKVHHGDASRSPAKDERAARAALLTQIHHIFLPPQLPKAPDTSPVVERALIETIQTALAQFRDYFDVSQTPELDRCVCMLGCMIDARDEHGVLNKDVLGRQMTSLEDQGIVPVLPRYGATTETLMRRRRLHCAAHRGPECWSRGD